MVEPITPAQVDTVVPQSFPEWVIETWNKLIVEKKSIGPIIKIGHEEALSRLCSEGMVTKETVARCRWMDIESVYSRAGWKVTFIKNDAAGSDSSFYLFTKRDKYLQP